ncbi:MAG: hypothetical protein NTW86_13345, partial [Candidatus Sumerlaeota bacterium]|nr:hypothetical protein [Candidatus Sumerlaeota bacterium]
EAPEAVRAFKGLSRPPYRFSWSDLGWIDPSTRPGLQNRLSTVDIGQFSRAERYGEDADVFFVAAEEKLSPEERDALERRAGRSAVSDQSQTSLEVYRGAIAQSLPIVYSY